MTFTRFSMKDLYKIDYELGLPGFDKVGLAKLVSTASYSVFLPSEYKEITGEDWVDPNATAQA